MSAKSWKRRFGWRMRLCGKRGFTLIELLVVVAIIGLLAALLLPALVKARCRAKEGTAQSQLRDIGSALKAYNADYAVYPRDGNPNPTGGGATTDPASNSTAWLVNCLSRVGPMAIIYYEFKREQLFNGNTATSTNIPGASVPPYPFGTCWWSPLKYPYWYRENAREIIKTNLFNPYSYDLWSRNCSGGAEAPLNEWPQAAVNPGTPGTIQSSARVLVANWH